MRLRPCRAKPFRTPGYRLGGAEDLAQDAGTAIETTTTGSSNAPASEVPLPPQLVGTSPAGMDMLVEALARRYAIPEQVVEGAQLADPPGSEEDKASQDPASS